jgi:hypothetical protein
MITTSILLCVRFRPKFTEKTNLVKFKFVILNFEVFLGDFRVELCLKLEDEILSVKIFDQMGALINRSLI